MRRPTRLALLASLLTLVAAAAASVLSPGPVSAQAYPEFLIENVRAHGTANSLQIDWAPPRVAKQQTVGTGDDATTVERRTGVSRYIFRFENRAAIDVVPSRQGEDVSTTVRGLEPGKRYHFSIQTCFDGTGSYSGCYLPEAYRSAYTAPKAPLFLSVDQARGDEISLSWEGGNTVDRQPFDLYDYFQCQRKRIEPGFTTPFSSCRTGHSDRAKNVTLPNIDTDNVYEIRVRHKARSFRTREHVEGHNYDVAVNYEAGPWQTVTVGGIPKAPANVRITRTTPETVTLAWDPVTETTSGGAIVGNVRYLVAYIWHSFRDCNTPDGQTAQCFNGDQGWGAFTTGTSATVRNLDRNKTYEFSVASRTEHRFGQSTRWIVSSPAPRRNQTFPQNQPQAAQRKDKITVTAANPLTVREGGAASYTVSLGVRPSSNVVVQTASDHAGVSTVPASLTFTPENWQSAQTVSVVAGHDGDVGDETATIRHVVSGADEYSSTGAPVNVKVTDDDRAGVTVSTTSLSLTEGETASYTVVLDAKPNGNVLISPFTQHSAVSAEPWMLTFTPQNWATPQTIRVTAVQDADTEDAQTWVMNVVAAFSGSGYVGVSAPTVNVSITDDDEPQAQAGQQDDRQDQSDSAPEAEPQPEAQPEPQEEPTPEPGSVTLSASSLPVAEGGSATYTVVLDAEPTANVTVSLSSNHAGVSTQPSSLTFTPEDWATAQTVRVAAAQDDDTSDESATISHAVSGADEYAGIAVASVSVAVTDDDEVQVQAEPTPEPQAEPEPQPAQQQTQEPVSEPEPAVLTDRDVLVAFYESTGGANWTNNSNWLSEKPLGQWHGVTTNSAGEVTHLALRINNLSGSLPAALGQLDALQVLSLDRNSLSGSLPAELGNLSNLTRLAMNRNSLSGSIPSELGNLSRLSIIGLARNQLSGSLPASLGGLSGLTKVSLHDNTGLSGPLPAGFGSMSGLSRLAVSRTGLSGALPQGLTGSSLSYLHFDDTGLCAPSDLAFQAWLAGVQSSAGEVCGP